MITKWVGRETELESYVRYGMVWFFRPHPIRRCGNLEGEGVGDDAEEVRALTPLPSPSHVYLSTLG